MSLLELERRSLKMPRRWQILSEWLPQGGYRMTPLKIVLAGAAAAALLVVLIQRLPGDTPLVVPRPSFAAQQDTPVWPYNAPALPKSDRAPILVAAKTSSAPPDPPKMIERIVPDVDVKVPPPPLAADMLRPADVKPKSHIEQDICTRHRMHKVITRGGRSWRCRK